MLDNRNSTTNTCGCQVLACVNKILSVLAVALGLVVGAIIGATATATITEALIPLEIFAVGIALAIVLIFFFVICKCRNNN